MITESIKDKMTATIDNFLNRYCSNISSRHFLLSLSGGKDSMVLADLFIILKEKYGFKISVFHLDHMTRNGESAKDAQLVQDFCSDNRLTCYNHEHDFCNSSNFEEKARDVRYSLMESLRAQHSIDHAITAHTLSDSVETVLMRVFRGTSIHGLQGIPACRDRYLRPLLAFHTEDILLYARDYNVNYREDSTNSSLSYDRNFIRHKVLPLISERFNPVNSIPILIDHAGSANKLLTEFIKEKITISRESGGLVLIVSSLLEDKIYFSYAVAYIMRDLLHLKISGAQIEEMYRVFVIKKTHITLMKSSSVIVQKGREGASIVIRFITSSDQKTKFMNNSPVTAGIPMEGKKTELLYNDVSYTISAKMNTNSYNAESRALFLYINNSETITFRKREPGDRIRRNGMGRSLKRLSIDLKLSHLQKEKAVVVVIENKVVAFLIDPYLTEYVIDDSFLTIDKSKKILAIHCSQK
jgi:tRNA(Ile)-lysidine synthetase-like protein